MDGRDGNGTQTTWLDRSGNGNNAVLHNSNFDSNGGWTGAGLKLDGVKDYVELNLSEVFKYIEVGVRVVNTIQAGWNRIVSFDASNTIMSTPAFKAFQFKLDTETITQKDFELNTLYDLNGDFWKNKGFKKIVIGKLLEYDADYSNVEICYTRFYNNILTSEEIQHNLEYKKNINRETVIKLIDYEQEKDYGIGCAYQLSDEQLKTFRLSNDKTKFVSGIKNCIGLQIEKYTYSEIKDIMETDEWKFSEVLN